MNTFLKNFIDKLPDEALESLHQRLGFNTCLNFKSIWRKKITYEKLYEAVKEEMDYRGLSDSPFIPKPKEARWKL